MNQKTVGLTLRAVFLALALILAAGPALPPLDGVAYANHGPTLTAVIAPGGASVTVSWTEIDDADGYALYRQLDGSGSWTGPISGVTGTTYSDPVSGLTAGASYFYIVRATGDDDDLNDHWSNTVKVAIPGGTSAPTGKPALSATADGLTAANLSWTAVSGATSYDLRRWNATTSSWDAIGGAHTGTTSYRDSGLTAGTTYYYVIRAVNDGGNGPWSSADGVGYTSVVLPATTTVPKLSHTHPARERVVLTWTQVAEGAEYQLQRERTVTPTDLAGGNVAWANLGDRTTGTTYTDEAATYVATSTSTSYKYRVQAYINGDAQAEYSNVVTVAIPASGVLPPVPGGVTATASSASSVVVTWGTVPVAASYELRFKTGTGDYGSPIATTKTTYTHSGRSAGTKYTYQVRSKNVNGESDWSAEKSATTPAVSTGSGLPTPTNLRVADATTVSGSTTTPKVRVTWSGVSGANSYEILIWTGTAWAAVTLGTTPTAIKKVVDDRAITLTGDVGGVTLASDKNYYFVIRARKVVDGPDEGTTIYDSDDIETETSDWSRPASGTTKALKPLAPTALSATSRGESSIWVSWTQPDAGENGVPTSYTIQWRRAGQGRSAMTVSGRKNYLFTGLSPNTDYYFRVRANNNSGTTTSGWWPDENKGTAGADVNCSTTTVAAERAQCATTEIKGTTAARALQPPSNIVAAAVNTTSIKLTWNKVTGATGYEIQRWSTEADLDAWVAVDANGDTAGTATTKTTFTHGSLTAGTTYYYVIRTVSGGDVKSRWSGLVTGMTKGSATTAAPSTFALLPTGQTTVRLTWAYGGEGPPAGITGYEVQYAIGAATAEDLGKTQFASKTISLTASPMYYVHSGLTAGTRYTYRIRATLANNVKGTWSGVTQVMTRPNKPELSATSTISRTVRLSWTPVTFTKNPDASPAAPKLVAGADYRIERRMSTSATWVNLGDLTLVADTGGVCDPKCIVNDTQTPTADATLHPRAGTKYFYRIRVDLAGSEISGTDVGVTSYWDTDAVTTSR